MNQTTKRCRRAQPGVSVVIPCRNERNHIEACLRDILAQDSPHGGFEVLVSDGRSDDGTREMLAALARQDTRLRIVDNPGQIVSTGLNAAIKEARGEIIVRLDAHTRYAANYIQSCVQALETTGADNVGGPWVAHGSGYVSRAIAAAFQCPWVVGGARGHDPTFEGEVDTVYLGCWRKSAFEKFGYFDDEFVRNQDDELSLRIIRQGGRIWQSPSIRSCYQPRKSLAALLRQYGQYGYWKVRVIQKHRLPASWRHLAPAALLLALTSLGAMALFARPALMLWFFVFGAYGVFNLAASVVAAAQGGITLLPMLPVVIAAYHFGYGYGFWRGIWDFIICGKDARPSFACLTRAP
jgi:succinoglycan biosynthesis protein ExoA